MGGFVPAMIPHEPALALQQSPSLRHGSPTSRQPEATWQTWPKVAVVTHRREQQLEPPAQLCPSTRQPPEPMLMSTAQVPAVLPAAIVHRPVQQSVP